MLCFEHYLAAQRLTGFGFDVVKPYAQALTGLVERDGPAMPSLAPVLAEAAVSGGAAGVSGADALALA